MVMAELMVKVATGVLIAYALLVAVAVVTIGVELLINGVSKDDKSL